MLPAEFQNLQCNADASRRRMEELYSMDPNDHRVIGCLATVDKFTASSSEDRRRQEVHKGNECLYTCLCIAYVGRDGALVEAITLNRRVVGSTPALAVT